ncbi:MAG: purine-nucleoside phosphorylase [Pirellulales bacterium]
MASRACLKHHYHQSRRLGVCCPAESPLVVLSRHQALAFGNMHDLHSRVNEAASVIAKKWPTRPRVGLVLGSGLGELADRIECEAEFAYSELPHFPRSTAVGHRGRLVCGNWLGVPVVAMQGRFHLYEGYSAQQVAFPVRVMQRLGIETLVLTNAAGGLNPGYERGDVMVIDDHVNLMFRNPLVGVNDDELGPRFPDMSAPYNPKLVFTALSVARRNDFTCHRGVYVGMLGPTYETRAEYRLARQLGGDAVGMSTVPEVIAARHGGLRVLGISTITNVCSPDSIGVTTAEDVIAVAATAAEKVRLLIEGALKKA